MSYERPRIVGREAIAALLIVAQSDKAVSSDRNLKENVVPVRW